MNYTRRLVQRHVEVQRSADVNYGGRLEYYTDGWPDQTVAPNGVPALANWPETLNPTERRATSRMSHQSVTATTVSESTTFAPRVGFAYDLLGDNRTVLKVFCGQFRFNSADVLADQQNPVARAQLRYAFNDLNGNRTAGRPAGARRVQQHAGRRRLRHRRSEPESPDGERNLDQRRARDSSGSVGTRGRMSTRTSATCGTKSTPHGSRSTPCRSHFNDIGSDGVAGTADDNIVQLLDRPLTAPTNRVYTNPDERRTRQTSTPPKSR